jgi:hypothetical protein
VGTTLNKAQVPTPPAVIQGKDWRSVWNSLTANNTYLQSLVRYLQTYLNSIQSTVIPLQYLPGIISNTQSPYNVSATDVFLGVAAGAASATIVNLPFATGSGRVLTIKKTDPNAFSVVPTAALGDTIDDLSSFSISVQYQSINVIDAVVGKWMIF